MNQKGGLYEYIDLEYCKAGAKSKLGLKDTTSEDMFLLDSMNYCLVQKLRNFGNNHYIVTQIDIDHEGATPKAKLPNGFIRFAKKNPIVYTTADGHVTTGTADGMVELSVSTDDGSNLGTLTLPSMLGYTNYCSPVFVNNAFFENSPFGGNNALGGTVNQVDGYLFFSDNVIAEFVKIAYYGTYYGDNGKVVIPAYFEGALVNYACHDWCNTQFLITGEGKYKAMATDFERKYITDKAIAKVRPLMPDSVEYEFINYTFNTLV